MQEILMRADNGGVADRIVEKMFSDLYHGTHTEDELTLHNFNVYVKEIYNVEYELKSFDNTAMLIEIISQVFGEKNYLTRSPGNYRIDFKSWDGKIFVQNSSLGVALALAIVQNLRMHVKAKFEGPRH